MHAANPGVELLRRAPPIPIVRGEEVAIPYWMM